MMHLVLVETCLQQHCVLPKKGGQKLQSKQESIDLLGWFFPTFQLLLKVTSPPVLGLMFVAIHGHWSDSSLWTWKWAASLLNYGSDFMFLLVSSIFSKSCELVELFEDLPKQFFEQIYSFLVFITCGSPAHCFQNILLLKGSICLIVSRNFLMIPSFDQGKNL